MQNVAKKYISFLRGINVGGHHKLPMSELKAEMKILGFENVTTILNSGNVIYDAPARNPEELDILISSRLLETFGFSVPVLTREAADIVALVQENPFSGIEVTKDTRLYVSFLIDEPHMNIELPWVSDDGSYRILNIKKRVITSVLDMSVNGTPKGMDTLEQMFGKGITTRNWKTLNRIYNKI